MHPALRRVQKKLNKKSKIPLITKPLHKHTFHITCMKGKIKKKKSKGEVKRQQQNEQ